MDTSNQLMWEQETVCLLRAHREGLLSSLSASGEWLFADGPCDDWLASEPHGVPCRLKDDFLDLDPFIDNPHEFSEGVLYYRFESPTDGIACIGYGIDWYCEVALNHTQIADLWKFGNSGIPYAVTNQRAYVAVKKGENLLTFHTRRGEYTGTFCFAFLNNVQLEAIPRVVRGPWLTLHSTTSRTVRFFTDDGVGAGVAYRKVGDTEWTTVWDAEYNRIQRRAFHAVHLEQLEPGVRYEYCIRVIVTDLPYCKPYLEDAIYTFEIPAREQDTFSFFYTADMQQYPQETAAQNRVLDTLLTTSGADTCQFMVLGGDNGSRFEIERFFGGMMSVMSAHGNAEKPMVFVRGNHDYRGVDSDQLPRLLGDKHGDFCGVFRIGNTAFLVLDCYEDRVECATIEPFRKYNLDEGVFDHLKTLVDAAIASPDWTEATHRIVLSHGAPYSQWDGCYTMCFTIQRLIDEYFEGTHPAHRVDLWLAGHTHRYTRSVPYSDEITGFSTPRRPNKGGKTYGFPVWTVTGPGGGNVPPRDASCFRVDVAPEGITITSFDGAGTIFEEVFYAADGRVIERKSLTHFTVPPLDDSQPKILL